MRDCFRQALREFLFPAPGPLYILVWRQNMTVFTLKVLLPPTVDSDVAGREFSYAVNGNTAVVTSLPSTATEFTFDAPRDASVLLSLVDIDTAGNRSTPSTRTFTVVDTIPPTQPGEMSVETVGQHEEPDA